MRTENAFRPVRRAHRILIAVLGRFLFCKFLLPVIYLLHQSRCVIGSLQATPPPADERFGGEGNIDGSLRQGRDIRSAQVLAVIGNDTEMLASSSVFVVHDLFAMHFTHFCEPRYSRLGC